MSVAVAWCLCQWRHISCLVHVSVTSHLVSVSEEWRWCQLMVVMICAPQTVSAYNLVGITFVRFLAVRKTVDVKKVQLHVASGTDVVPCLCSVELQNIYDAEPTFSLSCTSHHLYLKNIYDARTVYTAITARVFLVQLCCCLFFRYWNVTVTSWARLLPSTGSSATSQPSLCTSRTKNQASCTISDDVIMLST